MRFLRDYRYMAQRTHWCDRCCRDIQPGDYYEGMVYANKKFGIVVLKFHIEPICDYPEEPDEFRNSIEDSKENESIDGVVEEEASRVAA